MKKICTCALVLLIMCSKVFAAIPEYDTISPINLTIYSFEDMGVMRTRFTEAMRHFAVAVYEMTNGAHQLGRIKIIQRGRLPIRERAHINWLEGTRRVEGRPRPRPFSSIDPRSIGSYAPFSQNARAAGLGVRINHPRLFGDALAYAFRDINPDYFIVKGPMDTGYTFAHYAGHFIYGLLDEYTGMAGFIHANYFARIYDSLAYNMNSVMATQRRAVVIDDPRQRALALNFSTNYHYDLTNAPFWHHTAQRRLYPRTVSGWDTLVENVAPNTSRFSRSLFRDLRRVYPVSYMDITHTRGFPGPGADEAEFRSKSAAIEHLNIEWGTTDHQRARLFLIGGDLRERFELVSPSILWCYAERIVERVREYVSNMPEGSYIALWAFDSGGFHQIFPFGRVADTNIDLTHLEQALRNIEGRSTNIPLYDRLYDAISVLQRYMNPSCRIRSCTTPNCEIPEHVSGVILGDVVVILGSQAPDVSEAHSTISSQTARSPSSKDALIEKSRRQFIPISFEGFNIGYYDMSIYGELARFTGGTSKRSAVPTNPEVVRVIGGAVWRQFMVDADTSLAPWDGYMAYITRGRSGNFMGASARMGYPMNSEQQAIWFPLVTDDEDIPHVQFMYSRTIRPYSLAATPFYVDSKLKSFLAQITIRNPYRHDLEVVLIDPSGTEHPVEMNWRSSGRSGHTVVRINLNPSNLGLWRLICRGARFDEATINYAIIGVSRGLFQLDEEEALGRASTGRPYKGAIFTDINIANVRGGAYDRANGGDLFVTVTTHEGWDPLTNLNVHVSAQLPDGRIIGIPMSDGGNWPDAIASDGIFTGILRVGAIPEGQVILTASVSNPNRTATPTYFMNNTRHIGDFDLDGDSPFFGEPITERFYRRAQKAFDVIGTVPADARPLPEFETFALPIVSVSHISGPAYLLPGIEVEFSVGISPEGIAEQLAEYFAWVYNETPNLTITPDPEGRLNVIRMRFDGSGHGSTLLEFESIAPRALRGLMESQRPIKSVILTQPSFGGIGLTDVGFNWQSGNITVLEGQERFYNMRLILPPGYDDSASWTITANPDNAGEIVSQRADGVTFRTLRPGRFTMTLTSDIWPHLTSRSVEVHSVFREQPGSQPGRPDDDAFGSNPIPGRPDPGGDDDVRTRPGTGNDGGNGGGPSRDPEYQDPQDPVLLPPELSRITLGGRDITDDGVRLIRQWETVPLVLEFRESIDRYMLSAAFMSGTNSPHDATSATSTINNIALSEDGKTLAYEFMGKVPGQHRVFFNVERKDGIEAAGSFVLHVKPSPNLGGQGGPEEGEQGNEGSGGGGCNAGAGALAAMLVLAVAVWKIRKS